MCGSPPVEVCLARVPPRVKRSVEATLDALSSGSATDAVADAPFRAKILDRASL